MNLTDLPGKRKQRGFTLVELLLAVAIFAVLAAGSARLFDALVRTDQARQVEANEIRSLARAMGLLQRDALQGVFPPVLKQHDYALTLQMHRLSWLSSNGHDSHLQPRSDLRLTQYWLENGALWRQRSTLARGEGRAQRLLEGVTALRWRVYVPGQGWQADWPGATAVDVPPAAIEITLSTLRVQQVRRVLPMAGMRL
ncbi:type II secretion system minor pseudopilin GspJ [Pseudomonas sp. SAS7]|jgi:general secretion pathway protein J|uniref:type II secretion system minor pseudopilin GspJ n=1 Tax=Pseudomonas sp. SAS7 TaxID=3156487 RepID=UPI003F9A7FBA